MSNYCHLFGFEDYRIISLYGDALFSDSMNYWPWNTENFGKTYVAAKSIPSLKISEDTYDPHLSKPLYTNHPKILSTANKLYLHPKCSISRTAIAEKYKKVLNPWLADAIIMPECRISPYVYYSIVFCNEDKKLMVVLHLTNEDFNTGKTFEEGKPFRELCVCQYEDANHGDDCVNDVLDSKFLFADTMLVFSSCDASFLDIILPGFPTHKIVFEEDVQESLSSENNQITLDVLLNIRDMLESSDAETVGAGLKALSMLDYTHYPNSVRYIFSKLKNKYFKYNKAANSVSVKFMRKHLFCNSRWMYSYDSSIYKQDYNLFKQLVSSLNQLTTDSEVMNHIRYMPFITFDAENNKVVNFRH